MKGCDSHSGAELTQHQPHDAHVLLLFYHGNTPLNDLVYIKVVVQEPISVPVADDEILRPRVTYLGGVVPPPWPGPTTLSVSVTANVSVTINANASVTIIANVSVTITANVSYVTILSAVIT
jgi:hypothetical protein